MPQKKQDRQQKGLVVSAGVVGLSFVWFGVGFFFGRWWVGSSYIPFLVLKVYSYFNPVLGVETLSMPASNQLRGKYQSNPAKRIYTYIYNINPVLCSYIIY